MNEAGTCFTLGVSEQNQSQIHLPLKYSKPVQSTVPVLYCTVCIYCQSEYNPPDDGQTRPEHVADGN